MKEQELYRVLLAPIVSEKSTLLNEQDQKYVFKVKKTATKENIRKAIELVFDVHVEYVNVINVKGKAKRFGKFFGSRSDWKKAYVKLKEGYQIDLALT